MGRLTGSEIWGGRRESNPQQPEPQSGALPVELLPPQPDDYNNFAGVIGSVIYRIAGLFFFRAKQGIEVLRPHGKT
jgi:hypothetical protein